MLGVRMMMAAAGSGTWYGSDVVAGGTASADSEYDTGYVAAYGCDNDSETRWSSTNTPHPHWWKYDFGEGITKTVAKITLKTDLVGGEDYNIKDFTFQGSNDDSDWDTLYTGQHANNGDVQVFTFSNSTPYRYYRIHITNNWYVLSPNWASVTEIEMMEIVG